LIFPLIKAVQELSEEIERLKNERTKWIQRSRRNFS
jgi:hypothetical protein